MPSISISLQDAVDESAVIELQFGNYIRGNDGAQGAQGAQGPVGDVTPAAEAARDAALAAQAAADSAASSASSSADSAGTSASSASSSASSALTAAASALSSKADASTSAASAATSETNAAGSASAAATSATNAGNSATAAAGSASASSTSATNAANSASAAATSATNAATSASNAAASETNAAAILANSIVRPGTIVFHAKNTTPAGFLKANGAAVSRTTYADLFAEIGTTFGAGNGSTTFNLPDLRGEFLRGWDDGRGVDASRVFGSAQGNQMTGHQHTTPFAFDAGSFYSLGAGTPVNSPLFSTAGVSAYYKNMINNGASAGPISVQAALTSGASVTDSAETRPRNVALLACIKY